MRLSEIYTSIQGEGPNTGKPTTFVRFGGCNLRCPGWGKGELPDGTEVRGCDTIFAVYPEFKDDWEEVKPWTVLSRIPDHPNHVCITGGEPLTQRSSDLADLVEGLTDEKFTIDLFTNGTIALSKHLWTRQDNVTVVMDYKLKGSGEFGKFESTNLFHLSGKDAIKFVCKDRADFDQSLLAAETIERYFDQDDVKGNRRMPSLWWGPVWGVGIERDLVHWVITEYPAGRLNTQLHKYLWDPEARRT